MQSTLAVLEGHSAEIWTGTVQPASVTFERDRARGKREIEITPSVELRTGIRIRPRSLTGDAVELEIAALTEEPALAGVVQRVGAVTRVKLQLGEGMVIAGQRALGAQLITTPMASHDLAESSSQDLLWVRVTRADSDPRP